MGGLVKGILCHWWWWCGRLATCTYTGSWPDCCVVHCSGSTKAYRRWSRGRCRRSAGRNTDWTDCEPRFSTRWDCEGSSTPSPFLPLYPLPHPFLPVYPRHTHTHILIWTWSALSPSPSPNTYPPPEPPPHPSTHTYTCTSWLELGQWVGEQTLTAELKGLLITMYKMNRIQM